ncbi:MAG: DNA repair protein RadC [Proteobacteria bacterium]|nr:DNA repair protein RadC [Pseudomonadota bacterium]
MYEDPDTRLAQLGASSLADAELLSFLLTRGGAPGEHALGTARRVLEAATDLPHLAAMGEGELIEVPGIGPVRARRVVALAALARRISERPWPRGEAYTGPRKVYESLRGRLGTERAEVFLVVLLDSRLRKLRELEVCRGGRNSVSVLPRDVLEPALREGASALVVVHNHPSGDPTPSGEDIALTHRLAAASDLLGVALHDHVIIGDGRFASLAELGHLDPVPVGLGAKA